MFTKRKRTDPYAVRKARREAATKEELIQVLENIENLITDGSSDRTKFHATGVCKYIVDFDCKGCFVECGHCGDNCAVEDTETDDYYTSGICIDCLGRFEIMIVRRRKRQRKTEP